MSEHEQYAEDLALHALNALSGEERAKLVGHLESCTSCRNELEQLRGDTALLALSAVGPRPPQRSRDRLMKAIADETARRPVSVVERGTSKANWWGWLGWAAAAAVLLLAFSLWRQNLTLQELAASANSRDAESARQMEQLRRVAAPLLDPEAQRVTLVSAKTPPQPQGKAFYLKARNSLVFLANNMPALPAQKAYELWLIPTVGKPIPAGVFRPDAHGSASVVNPPVPSGVEAKAFAITVEAAEGSPVPTSPILMMGAGE